MRLELPEAASLSKHARNAVLWLILPVTIGLLGYEDFALIHPPSADPAVPETELNVQPWRDKLQLTWNPTAAPLRNAKAIDLSISDGDRRIRMPLSADARHNGNIVYKPITDDVAFEIRTRAPRPDVMTIRYAAALAPSTGPVPAKKPNPFVQVRFAPAGSSRIALPLAPAHVPTGAPASRTPVLRAALIHVEHGFAKLWPFHHNSEDGGRR